MAQTVIGLFDSAAEAHQAVEQLFNQGFTSDNIDLSVQIVAGTGTGTAVARDEDDRPGDRVGNFFGSLFGGSDESSVYSNVARQSGSLVTVHAQSGDEAQRAAIILDHCGAIDIDERAAQYGYPRTTGTTADATAADGATSIPIVEERLQVGKRVVETGVTRLRSRIVERTVEEHVRLREQHVRIERTAVDRLATEADLANFRDGEVEMIESAEVAVVTKEARVVEEVTANKDVEAHEETIRDTVRRTEVDVEKIDPLDPDGLRR